MGGNPHRVYRCHNDPDSPCVYMVGAQVEEHESLCAYGPKDVAFGENSCSFITWRNTSMIEHII